MFIVWVYEWVHMESKNVSCIEKNMLDNKLFGRSGIKIVEDLLVKLLGDMLAALREDVVVVEIRWQAHAEINTNKHGSQVKRCSIGVIQKRTWSGHEARRYSS